MLRRRCPRPFARWHRRNIRCPDVSGIFSSAANVPVITMPAKLEERVRKVQRNIQLKDLEKQRRREMAGNRDVPVISCKNKLLNHYKGQTYASQESIRLASQGWAHRKTAGDYFTLNSYAGNPALSARRRKDEDDTKSTFENFGLRPELVARLHECGIKTPTRIQELAIPDVARGCNAMCAAETGSGKSLAFLLPILSNILDIKDMVNRDYKSSAPLALILVPGRELAFQIKSVISMLTENLPINTAVQIGGLDTKRKMCNPPVHSIDVLIGTLGVVRKMVSSGVYNIRDVRHIVIDEADSMMDDSFNYDTISFLNKFKFREVTPAAPADPNVGVQLVMVGATLPQSLSVMLNKTLVYNSIHHISTPHLHRLMPHVSQKFLRLKRSEKPAQLLKLVKPQAAKRHNVLIFSKNSATCDFVSMFLEENGVKALNLNGLLRAELRVGRFQQFQDGTYNVLSSTDLGSRGLDTIKVQNVINYDFPNFMSDYIHRAGRVGRVGSHYTGFVTNFVTENYEVELVQKIERAARGTSSLPDVDANIKKVHFDRYEEDEEEEEALD